MTRLATQTTWFRGLGAVETWDARRDETRRVLPGRGATEVLVESGVAVVTQAGHAEDVVLEPGQAVRLTGPGLAVIWALEAARVVVRRDLGATDDAPHRPLAA
jgi:hypothetical protein